MSSVASFLTPDRSPAFVRQLLAQKAEIPVDALDSALASYDKLFPIDGGWLVDQSNSRIRLGKLSPGPPRGIGAFYRLMDYAEEPYYNRLVLAGDCTAADLKRWHCLAVRVFEGT